MKYNILFVAVLINVISLNLISQPLVLRSDFMNIRLTPKDNGSKEFISPKYTISYIFIGLDEDDIGIHIFDPESYEDPITFPDFKIVNDPSDENSTVYYTREGDFLIWDHNANMFNWVSESDNLKTSISFQGLVRTSETEYYNYSGSFNVDDPVTNANFSNNSHNLIGFSIQSISDKLTESFEDPIDITNEFNIKETKIMLALFFRTINEDGINFIYLFNHKGVCTKIMQIYPIGFLNGVINLYNKYYGFNTENKIWYEKTYNSDYVYQIENNGAKSFILSVSKKINVQN